MRPPEGLLTGLPPGSKILFVRLRSLGDTILSTPLYAALKDWRPDLQLSALVEEPYDEVLRRNPDLQSVFPLPVQGAKRRSTSIARWQTLRQIRRERFDCCINLHGGTTSAWLTAMSGARYRIGLRGYRNSFCYNVRTKRPSPPPGIRWHSARFQLEWLYHLGLEKRLRSSGAPLPRPCAPVRPGGSPAGCRTPPLPAPLRDSAQLSLPYQGVDRFRICRDLGYPAERARLCHLAGRYRGGGAQDQEGGRPLPNPACCDLGPFDLRADLGVGSGQSVRGK